MNIPQIQISQQPALLGIDADLGKQDLQQPRPTLDLRQVRPELQIKQPRGKLEINQDRAWDALGLGNNLQTMSKIYSAAKDIALRGLAKIVENGNRMSAIHVDSNPFAELASDWRKTFPEFDFRGPASFLNVDTRFTPGSLSIQATPGRVEVNAQVNAPIHNYTRGQLDIHMLQYPRVEITPPAIDKRV
ncbi:DUF6470 family protein [Paenibacillus daejeonensis]|uniref:DUF6470 family protein n=1 Tax=Paenibacillus daejeonensis TaxID=135193 RepID=UPI00035DCCDD|nr:DUF6470 family protein [Paenibacillus daejeonensis]